MSTGTRWRLHRGSFAEVTQPGELVTGQGNRNLHTCQPSTMPFQFCFLLVSNCLVNFALFYSETWSHCVVLAVQNSLYRPGWPWPWRSTCLSHPSAGIHSITTSACTFLLILTLKSYKLNLYQWMDTIFKSREEENRPSLLLFKQLSVDLGRGCDWQRVRGTSVMMAFWSFTLCASSGSCSKLKILERGTGFPLRHRTAWHVPTLATVKLKLLVGSAVSGRI